MARHLVPDNLSENTGISEDPQISSEGNKVYVVWVDSFLVTLISFIQQTIKTLDYLEMILNLSNNPGESVLFFDPQISSSP